jgi:glycosyltransferase involved in cell wall biosynthesis
MLVIYAAKTVPAQVTINKSKGCEGLFPLLLLVQNYDSATIILKTGGISLVFRDTFLTFDGNSTVATRQPLCTNIENTFTIEFWAKPEALREADVESAAGITKSRSQRFAITPVFGAYGDGDYARAGIGVSVGTNGISVYEHTTNHLTAALAADMTVDDWTHIAVVYVNKTPSLYVNGQLIKHGVTSIKEKVVPSAQFGGLHPYGFYMGSLQEIRIWNTARTASELSMHMHRELTGKEIGLCKYWKMDEGAGSHIQDFTSRQADGTLSGAKWKTARPTASDSGINVLFTFFIPSGGVETLNRQRFYALNQDGINCHFLYTQPGTGLQNEIETSIFVTGDEEEIKKIVLQGNYDAIIVGSDLQLLQKIKKFGYQGALIYEIQGLGFNKEYADYFLKNHAYSVIQQYSDAILYPQTPHLIEAFEKHFPAKKKYCFHNCFNTAEFRYRPGPKKKQPIIGWVGRLEENKNWRDFLSIGAELIKDIPSLQLWMFEDNTLGEKSERIAFQQKINEWNLRPHLMVYANQPHDKMADYFSMIGDSGGFLCSTSKVEGFGYAVLEAMVCRCPVLSTDSDGVRSFIQHNITGKFFELGNISQAVQEGRELLSNLPLREKMRNKAVEHIETHFSLKQYQENFLNMIHSLKN